jgi:TolB-like protein/DNA-binding winged helix-turn-helix (wHTH) protein/cytochrome c-type biogenesis protein CcmH/NrfG
MSEETGWRSTPKDFRETPRSPERRSTGDIPEIYEFGPFRLEPAERKLLRGNEVVALTPKAFDTLHLLVRNSGHLLEKDELIRMLWPDSFVEEGNLTNNIFLLRKALGQDPEYIETVPKKGYRFVGAVRRLPTAELVRPDKPRDGESESVAEVSGARHPPVSLEPTHGPTPFPRAFLASAAVVVALVGFLVVWYRMHGSETVPPKTTVAAITAPTGATVTTAVVSPPPAHSVAVLPFVNLSEEKNDEYFSDGLSEELIGMLARIPDLHVPARTSSFYFKGKNEDISTIARRLSVAHILEGSVRKSGKHLRISVQLIRVDNGYHLWSETYDRQLDDVFKVQDEIARAVVSALKITLLTGTTLRSPPTSSTEAYTLQLESEFLAFTGTKAELANASDKLRRAVQVDPTFALAWAQLSRLLTNQAQNHYLPFEEIHDEALRAATRALKLDPALPSAHIALGKQRLYFDGDWAGADREFKQALQLDPGDADALRWASTTAECYGRHEEALELAEQAVSRDPLYAANPMTIAQIYAALGRFDDAEAAARKAVEVDPQGRDLHLGVAYVLLAKGKPDEALAEVRLGEDAVWRLAMEAMVYHALGRTADADATLAQFREKYGRSNPYTLAQIYARRGERSQALAELERAAAGKRVPAAFCTAEDAGTGGIKGDLSFSALADDPRFKALLRKINLPE